MFSIRCIQEIAAMSVQLSLDRYFKTKTKSVTLSHKSMNNLSKKTNKTKVKKTLNLSLTKSSTPVKISRIKEEPPELETKPEKQVINISSDEDDFCTPKKLNIIATGSGSLQYTPKKEPNSDSSEGTIIYALTPHSVTSPQTPVKTPRSFLSPKSVSPGSKGKFYSPVKKRVVKKRTPVKRKLEPEFMHTKYPVIENDDYARDDKTKALINMIIKYLENESLKELLSEESQMLLFRCLNIVKPGIRVVCRLYWRKPGWYKVEQVKAIVGEENQIDDPSLHLMLESLIAEGWVVKGTADENGGNLTFDDLTAILKSDELKQICKDLKLKIQSKQSAIDALRGYRRQSSIGNYFTGSQQNNSGRVLRM